jgi:hypothetical protein
LECLLLPLVLHRQLLPYEQMSYICRPPHVYHTHFLLLQTVCQFFVMEPQQRSCEDSKVSDDEKPLCKDHV